jgi:hypothetical protein
LTHFLTDVVQSSALCKSGFVVAEKFWIVQNRLNSELCGLLGFLSSRRIRLSHVNQFF